MQSSENLDYVGKSSPPPSPNAMPEEPGSPTVAGVMPPRKRLLTRWQTWVGVVAALVLIYLLRAQIAVILPAPVALWIAPGKPGGFAIPPKLVGVAKVAVREVPVQVTAIGSIDPLRTVNVKSRVDGQVLAVKFKAGDEVKAGEVLFRLDDRPAQAALNQAEAALARDIATLENQKRELARQEQLMAAKITTQQDYDSARTAVAVTSQVLVVDRAAIDNAKLILDYNTIRAPIGGRTGKVLIDLGNVVKANDTVSMVTINQIQPVYVTFSVPQRYLGEIRARLAAGKLPVKVSQPDTARALADGHLNFVDNSVDTSTGTISLRAVFPNENEALWPGQFVTVTLVLSSERDAIVVPPEAVQTGRDGPFVYVVKPDSTVQFRVVTVDRIVNGAAVISKGLQSGDTVVTDGQLNLIDGSRVQVATAAARDGKS